MFYQFLGCAFFATMAVAVIGFASIMKKDKPEAEAGQDKLERVERSWCCFAPVAQGLVRPGNSIDPPEYGDFCTACGRGAEVGVFLRDPEDGMLIEVETGEKIGEEQPGFTDLDFGGPDPDTEREERLINPGSRMGRSWRF